MKQAPSGRTSQSIFAGYENKNMKQWIATLTKHLDQANDAFVLSTSAEISLEGSAH